MLPTQHRPPIAGFSCIVTCARRASQLRRRSERRPGTVSDAMTELPPAPTTRVESCVAVHPGGKLTREMRSDQWSRAGVERHEHLAVHNVGAMTGEP